MEEDAVEAVKVARRQGWNPFFGPGPEQVGNQSESNHVHPFQHTNMALRVDIDPNFLRFKVFLAHPQKKRSFFQSGGKKQSTFPIVSLSPCAKKMGKSNFFWKSKNAGLHEFGHELGQFHP